MPKEFQAWEDSTGTTYAPAENIKKLFEQGMLEPDAKLVFTYTARTYVDAMQAYYDFYDFGEYVPMKREDGTLYEEDHKEY